MIDNPLVRNGGGVRTSLLIVAIIQISLWGLVLLDSVGFDIPVLRQVVGFIYMAFLPGIILVNILRLYSLSFVEKLLYSAGLSIAYNMFLGFFINFAYPYLGITSPLSIYPVLITSTILLLILCFVVYRRNDIYSSPIHLDVQPWLSSQAFFFYLLPFISVLGTVVLNFFNSSIVQLILLLLVSLAVFLSIFNKLIKEELYLLVIFSFSLSLLLHISLVTFYLPGFDARLEYYICNLVMANGHWDSLAPANPYNAMLSTTVLPAMFSDILNIDSNWTFKLIWPLIFSMVPIGLYTIYAKQTTRMNAFLATFYFIVVLVFYTKIAMIPRQELAMFFLMLLILLMVSSEISILKRAILSIVFAFALITSHYGTSYLLMALALLVLLIQIFPFKYKRGIFTVGFVSLLCISALTFYIYVSGGTTFAAVARLGEHIASIFQSEFFSFQERETAFILLGTIQNPLNIVNRVITVIFQVFIVIGVFSLLSKHVEQGFTKEYMAFTLVSLIALIACILIPFLSDQLSVERVYGIVLLFLAPFCIIGGKIVFGITYRILNLKLQKFHRQQSMEILISIPLIIFLLLGSGFIYSILGVPFEMPSLKPVGSHPWTWFSKADTVGGQWLLKEAGESSQIWCDFSGGCLFMAYKGVGFGNVFILSPVTLQLERPIPPAGLIYLRQYNLDNHSMLGLRDVQGAYKRKVVLVDVDELLNIDDRNMIYINGGTAIYQNETIKSN
jgi:uncharacterized membrane protein